MVNIIVIDGNLLYCRGMVSTINDYPEFRVVGEVSDIDQVLARSWEPSPHAIVIDAFTNGSGGAKSVLTLRQKFPGAKVIIMTSSSRQGDFLQAMRAGARGYLLKTAGPAEMVECIRLVTKGDAIVSPSKVLALLDELATANDAGNDWRNRLSPRETEVLKLVAQGASNKQIASSCYVSETTIKAHVRKILEKLSVKNRAEAVALATSQGLLDCG